MTIQLRHIGLAEAHHFGIAAAAGVKVGAALGAADGQAGHGILKDLLKAQEFDDGQIDRGVKPQAAFVGTQRSIELHAITAVHMPLMVVILPGHAKFDHALGLNHALQQRSFFIFGVHTDDRFQRGQYLFHRLQKFRFIRIARHNAIVHALNIFTGKFHFNVPFACKIADTAQRWSHVLFAFKSFEKIWYYYSRRFP